MSATCGDCLAFDWPAWLARSTEPDAADTLVGCGNKAAWEGRSLPKVVKATTAACKHFDGKAATE